MAWKTVTIFLYVLKLCADGAYYYSNGVHETWDQANDNCKSKGLQLAKFDSQIELDSAVAYMKTTSNGSVNFDVWIGMRYDMTSNPYVYRWISCEIPVFFTWGPDEPNNQVTDQCIRIGASDFKYRTKACTDRYDFLCTDPSPPLVFRNVSGVTSTFGVTVTFECRYCSILPILTVTWEFNNDTNHMSVDVTTNTAKYSGATLTSPSLVVKNVAESDIGTYLCQVKTLVATASGNSISFNIADFPIVKTSSTLYTVEYGNTVTLNCDIYGIPSITTVKWNINNQTNSFQYDGVGSTHYGLVSTLHPELLINNVTLRDGGNYSCVASNAVGATASKTITVQVLGDVLVVTTPLIKYTVVYGNTITLNSDIYGKPSITDIKWKIINGTGSFQYGGIGSTHYGTVSTSYPELHINNVTFQDGGSYSCVALNAVGTTTSQTITVQVLGDVPVVTINQTMVSLIEFQPVILYCEIQSFPNATSVYWKKEVDGAFSPVNTNTSGGNLTEPSLHILATQKGDSGNYTCVAVNDIGTTISSKVRLDVLSYVPMCPCSCDFKAKLDYWSTQNKTKFTFEEWQVILAPVVEELRKNLTVDVSTLTQTKLKYISVYDGRKSSIGIGVLGIVLISSIVIGLILIDMTSWKRRLKTAKMA